jgi:hypothetical protein
VASTRGLGVPCLQDSLEATERIKCEQGAVEEREEAPERVLQ